MPFAHVKWFIDYKMGEDQMSPIYDFSLHNPAIIIWLSIVLILVLAALILSRFLKQPPEKFREFTKRNRGKIIYIFQAFLALSLLFAAYNGAVLEPHYTGATSIQIIQGIQVVTAILLLTNFAIPFAAVLLLISYLSIIYFFSFSEAIDYMNLIGISVFLFWRKSEFALAILRVFTGLALFTLAFSEKLLFPGRALEFLEHYQLNFMQMIGFHGYTNSFFTLSAGAVEAAFGIILILGLITRVNIAALTGFFLASNIFFFVQGYNQEGFVELMGHLPIIGTAIVLFAFGAGRLIDRQA